MVGLLVWLGWLVGSWLEIVLGKPTGKWIKYLVMSVVIPFSLIVCILPSAYIFNDFIWEPLPKWIWGKQDASDLYDKK